MRESLNAKVAHSDDIWRSRGSGTRGLAGHDVHQGLVSRRASDTDKQGAADKEQTESEVHRLEGILDIDSRTDGFRRYHRNILGSDNSEAGGPEGSQEAFKAAQGAGAQIFHKRARVVPVAETVGIMLRIPAHHRDEGEEEQREDQNDLSAGEPEFGFTVRSHSKNIDGSIHDTQC